MAELDEKRAWYERAYRGDEAPQLTPRAVGMGAALGFFLAVTNVYIGLKAGVAPRRRARSDASSRSRSQAAL